MEYGFISIAAPRVAEQTCIEAINDKLDNEHGDRLKYCHFSFNQQMGIGLCNPSNNKNIVLYGTCIVGSSTSDHASCPQN